MTNKAKLAKETKKEKESWIDTILKEIYATDSVRDNDFCCEDVFLRGGCIGATTIC